ncbi:MAG: hypothetical protein GW939_04565, partial [Candidatus Magasanikbacteria bacterium]|nr:hypothetical protein [Candidatus Magasanikbacteria bacterium]
SLTDTLKVWEANKTDTLKIKVRPNKVDSCIYSDTAKIVSEQGGWPGNCIKLYVDSVYGCSPQRYFADSIYFYGRMGIGVMPSYLARLNVGGHIWQTNTGQSVFLGKGAGQNDDLSDNRNTFVGDSAGYSNVTGFENIFLGCGAGRFNTGDFNNFVGSGAGYNNTSGHSNVFFGRRAGYSNVTASDNTLIGSQAGYNITGSYNTILGSNAGFNAVGSGNVFIGRRAGRNETGSNKLYIDNDSSSTPLIYGDFANDSLKINATLLVNSNAVIKDTLKNIGIIQTNKIVSFDTNSVSFGSAIINFTIDSIAKVNNPQEGMIVVSTMDSGVYYEASSWGGAVDSSTDDAERFYYNGVWSWSTTATGIRAGFWSLNPDYLQFGCLLRWTNVTIPQGIVLDSAVIKICCKETFSTNYVLSKIQCEDTNSATTFSTNSDFESRSWTSAIVYWDSIPGWTAGTWYSKKIT